MACDHAVHHAGGGDHVGAGAGVADGLLGQERQRGVVVDVHPAADLGQRAAMAVVGVLAEAQVGDHQQIRRSRLATRIACWTIPSSRSAADPRASLCSGMPKRMIAGMPSSATSATAFAQPVERELILARHRGDLAPQVLAVVDEQRVDQVVHGQMVLADQLAKPGWPRSRRGRCSG